MSDHAKAMLEAVGVDCSQAGLIEIHPSFAMDVDELRQRLDDTSPIVGDRYFV